ncbi:MAG: 50S ribosomal protein L23 [Deltaproteobacteria bacterium]|nr:50S ribosomal protein L23 [Deltaproteobacteria bacterium]
MKVGLHEIIVRPLINEKSQQLRDLRNQYVFEVAQTASKDDVKAAVQKFFNVKVTDVRTLINHGKKRRVGQTIGRRSNWKKAIVTLAQGQTIDFFAQA